MELIYYEDFVGVFPKKLKPLKGLNYNEIFTKFFEYSENKHDYLTTTRIKETLKPSFKYKSSCDEHRNELIRVIGCRYYNETTVKGKKLKRIYRYIKVKNV